MDEKISDLAKKLAEMERKFPFPKNLMQEKRGGVLTTKCNHCGGTVFSVGEGIVRRVCSDCGKEYHETIYG